MSAATHRLTEEEHERIFQTDIKPDLFAKAVRSEQPTAVIFGGQPGAGKSAALDQAVDELAGKGGSVQIIGDDLRAYHPKYAQLMIEDDRTAAFYTDRDSGRWVEKSIAFAKAEGINVVIEGTFRNPEVVANTMTGFKEAGYQVDARVLAVNEKFSEQGILQRYEAQKADRGTGRMTTPEAHAAAYQGLPVTLARVEDEKLADKITVMRRGAEVIYSNRLVEGRWEKELGAVAAVQAERARPFSLEEKAALADSYAKLVERVNKPERNATSEERSRVTGLEAEARNSHKAEVFRRVPQDQAIAKYPDLAGPYAVVAAAGQAAAGVQVHKDRETVTAMVRNQVAGAIENGRVPEAKLREETRQEVRPSQDVDRS